MAPGRAARAAAGASAPRKRTRPATPSSRRERLERRALGAVADHVEDGGGQRRQRAQDVGVALARDEVAEGHEARRVLDRARVDELGPEVHHAGARRAELAAAPLDPRRVGEHEPRMAEGAGHGGVA